MSQVVKYLGVAGLLAAGALVGIHILQGNTGIQSGDIPGFIASLTQKQYDDMYLALVMYWGPISCLRKDQWIYENNPTNPCPGTERWYMHGLWPQNHDPNLQKPTIIRQCKPISSTKTRRSYDSIVENTVKNDLCVLEKFWYDVGQDPNDGPYEFLQHEFNGHGFCAVALNMVPSIDDYFKLGTAFYYKYGKIGKYLMESQINPGDNPTEVDIINAIKKGLDTEKNPGIGCSARRGDPKKYLNEVYLCFNVKHDPIELIDCPPHTVTPDRVCEPNAQLIYKIFK